MRGPMDPDENEAFDENSNLDENYEFHENDDFDFSTSKKNKKEQIAKNCRGCDFSPILQS